MFQWWKRKRQEKKLTVRKKLRSEIFKLREELDRLILLNQIHTKQYNDFMVESEQRAKKYKTLLEQEKASNGKLLEARSKEIGKLRKELEDCQIKIKKLTENNELLRSTLGHF